MALQEDYNLGIYVDEGDDTEDEDDFNEDQSITESMYDDYEPPVTVNVMSVNGDTNGNSNTESLLDFHSATNNREELGSNSYILHTSHVLTHFSLLKLLESCDVGGDEPDEVDVHFSDEAEEPKRVVKHASLKFYITSTFSMFGQQTFING